MLKLVTSVYADATIPAQAYLAYEEDQAKAFYTSLSNWLTLPKAISGK